MQTPNRRAFLAYASALSTTCWTDSATARTAPAPLLFGLTPVFLDDQSRLLRDWRSYLEQHLARPVSFVQRGSYREIVEMLRSQQLDLAWVCGNPYVRHQDVLNLLVSPIYEGKPLYRSYLIVPHDDYATRSILDLAGKVHAFSDPDSFSGYILPRYHIRQGGQRVDGFFSRVVMTHTHRNVIQAVADRLVDGGNVDGYVWDMLDLAAPHITGLTRIVCRSPFYGFPPIVCRASLAMDTQDALMRVLEGMSQETEGRRLLAGLGLDGFMRGTSSMYDDIRNVIWSKEGAA